MLSVISAFAITHVSAPGSHLAAHDQGVHKRNTHSNAILEHLWTRGKVGLRATHARSVHSSRCVPCAVRR